MKYKCPCCGYYTFEQPLGDTYDICPVCFWEDDGLQFENPNMIGGANGVSLNQARKNYQKFGACEFELKKYVRPVTKEDTICADIAELLSVGKRINYPGISLEGHLEVVIGDYFVSGSSDGLEYVYWPVDENNFAQVLYKKEWIVAIISESAGFAFVCDREYDRFCKDTKEYCFKYIRIDSLTEENLKCEHPERLPEEYRSILWIDDDFLEDAEIEFDYKAFEQIDSGVDYLNPKHFSIYEFAKRINRF